MVIDLPQAFEQRREIRVAAAQGHGSPSADAIFDVYAPYPVTISREFVAGMVSQRTAVARIVIHADLGMWQGRQQPGELRWVQSRLQVQFDARFLDRRQGPPQQADHGLQLRLAVNARGVHEGHDDPAGAQQLRAVHEPEQGLHAVLDFVRGGPQQRTVHEVVGTNGKHRNAVLCGETLDPLKTRVGRQRINVLSEEIEDPLDAIEFRGGRQGKLVRPPLARKALKTVLPRRDQAALHDS